MLDFQQPKGYRNQTPPWGGNNHRKNRPPRRKLNLNVFNTEKWFDIMIANGTLMWPDSDYDVWWRKEFLVGLRAGRLLEYKKNELSRWTIASWGFCHALLSLFHDRIVKGELVYESENTPAETQPLPDHQASYSLNLPTASANIAWNSVWFFSIILCFG